MKNFPQQPDNIEDGRQALAPYNFVPLPERIIRLTTNILPDQDQYHADRLSGYIDCELTTESPLYTRAALLPKNYAAGVQAKDESAFFYVTDKDKPVIPGSSLRGLLRGIVEIVSYSKIQNVSDKKLVYRAVGDTTSHGNAYRDRLMQFDGERNRKKHYTPLIRGGYIVKHNGEWAIQPAQEIGGTTYAHLTIDERLFNQLHTISGCHNAFEIYIQTGNYDYQSVRGGFLMIKYAPVLRAEPKPQPGLRRGTLARSGAMSSKRTEAVVYEADKSQQPISLTDDMIDDYRNQVSKEQDALLGGKDGVLRENQPVFYITDEKGDLDFFGHARMFRLPYPASPFEFVPPQLRQEEDLDMAEAIFGFTKKKGEGKAQAFAGRIFISDAQLLPDQGEVWLTEGRVIAPKILASPKPTTFQHYLVQTKPNRKQVGQTRDGRPKYTLTLNDYAARTPSETVIRGHKFYWHKGNAPLSQIEEPDQLSVNDTQHTRIQPVKPGVKFQFRIDFENLLLPELGALLWVLQVAGNDAYRLKIGMGKPLGMGAVKMTHKLYTIDRNVRYTQLFSKEDWRTGWKGAAQMEKEACASFERFVLNSLQEPSVKDLTGIERIKALLQLLSWPGPVPEDTRYMEIERREGIRKTNEYRDRPVLPLPSVVMTRRETYPKASQKTTLTISGKQTPEGYKSGTVKKFASSYGFITPDGGGQDIFVHRSGLAGSLKELVPGQRVIFKEGQGMRGPAAQDVRPEE